MKSQFSILLSLSLVMLLTSAIQATDLYVSLTGGHVPPFTNWVSAATNIQAAVDAATSGDTVWVTNGTYATGGRAVDGAMTNRVAVDKRLTLQSVNGPAFTLMNGGSSVRCVYLADGAVLSGFTLTNGATRSVGDAILERSGGGVYCAGSDALLTNCVVTGNQADYDAGGVWDGTLNNCKLLLNSANGLDASGGGASQGTLANCTLAGNSAAAEAGGAEACFLNNCTLTGNSAQEGGGAWFSTLNNCTLAGNSAINGGGAWSSTLNNCTLTGNSAQYGGGAYGDWGLPRLLSNCTLTGNTATGSGGGVYGALMLQNSVIAYNAAWTNANYSDCTFDYCCTTPLPASGIGNISRQPIFVNYAAGNLRLQSNSPCINAGYNDYAPASPDLDGNSRIVGGTVDIGAYEFQSPASTLSYAWAQQYGLPTDGSADYADPDHDGLNNWQEWRCRTDPTNAASALRMVSSTPAGTNVTVTWQSVADVTYFLEWSTNLPPVPSFMSLATNLAGQAGTTTFTHTNPVSAKGTFYRVGVQ